MSCPTIDDDRIIESADEHSDPSSALRSATTRPKPSPMTLEPPTYHEGSEHQQLPPGAKDLFNDTQLDADNIQHASRSDIPPSDIEQPPPSGGRSPSSSTGRSVSREQSADVSDVTSKSRSQSISAPPGRRKSSTKHPVQLIPDLPVKTEEALNTFTQLSDNVYQNKSIGRNYEMMESMTCECLYSPGDPIDAACGARSDCINRLTQIECLPDDCRCGKYCQNQRFRRKEYANIEIVLTEQKGYGLRAESDIPKDTFVYEYIGEVVSPPRFKQRMRDYATEGIKHFYFMMLQKDEFIDATKQGGMGRFANHSCNPNCYVAKWTVGDFVRMGIFAKRNIQKHEELTFNYNVDRYGHQAQTCHCGEPNCVGFIGGKTQTDVATLDDLYLDALGLDEDDVSAMKGTKKKKGKRIDDPDFAPSIKPLVEKDVPKVLTALRTATNNKIISKLLNRITICEDPSALFVILRLRGLSVMHNLMTQNKEDPSFLTMVMQSMMSWPLLTRNKLDASKVPDVVQECSERSGDADDIVALREIAAKLLAKWVDLKTEFRIPKRAVTEADLLDISKRRGVVEVIEPELPAQPLPVEPKEDSTDTPEQKRRRLQNNMEMRWRLANEQRRIHEEQQKARNASVKAAMEAKNKISSFINASAKEKAAAEEAAKEQERSLEAARLAKIERREKRRLEKEKRSNMTDEQKEALKEKRLLKLVGEVVVKCMSKHQKAMDHDSFKKYAKELTQTIADKEKKSSTYRNNKLDSLSPEKVEKIKKFAKQYIAKILHRLAQKKKQEKGRHGTSAVATTSASAPGSFKTDSTPADDMDIDDDEGLPAPGGDDDDDGPPAMSVAEAMDLDESDSSDDEATPNGDAPSAPIGETMQVDTLDPPDSLSSLESKRRLEEVSGQGPTSDPRLRHLGGDDEVFQRARTPPLL